MIKQVICYPKNTMYLGLKYRDTLKINRHIKILETLILYNFIRYIDNNYTDSPKNCKSVIGYYFYINKIPVSWYTKK